jgi:DNA-binding NarL/FixJ family response regulator
VTTSPVVERSGAPPHWGRGTCQLPTVVCGGFDARLGHLVTRRLSVSGVFDVVEEIVSRHRIAGTLDASRPNAAVVAWDFSEVQDLRELAKAHPTTGFIVLMHGLNPGRSRALTACGVAAALRPEVDGRVLVAATILAAFGMEVHSRIVDGEQARYPAPSAQLSSREAEVAALLEFDLKPGEIASVLQVSVPTIKSHTRSIYRKLRVHSREHLRRTLAEQRL